MGRAFDQYNHALIRVNAGAVGPGRAGPLAELARSLVVTVITAAAPLSQIKHRVVIVTLIQLGQDDHKSRAITATVRYRDRDYYSVSGPVNPCHGPMTRNLGCAVARAGHDLTASALVTARGRPGSH